MPVLFACLLAIACDDGALGPAGATGAGEAANPYGGYTCSTACAYQLAECGIGEGDNPDTLESCQADCAARAGQFETDDTPLDYLLCFYSVACLCPPLVCGPGSECPPNTCIDEQSALREAACGPWP